jgi:hypothetical protein
MPSAAFDWSRASVARYVQAVLALTPADWDRLRLASRHAAAEHALAAARAAGHPDPTLALPQRTPPPTGWRRVAAGTVVRGLEAFSDWTLAPAWRRHGTGPARLLYERFQHPYVTFEARHVIEVGLILLSMRSFHPILHEPAFRRVSTTLNAVLPWDAIWTTPDADGTVGQLTPAEAEAPGEQAR